MRRAAWLAVALVILVVFALRWERGCSRGVAKDGTQPAGLAHFGGLPGRPQVARKTWQLAVARQADSREVPKGTQVEQPDSLPPTRGDRAGSGSIGGGGRPPRAGGLGDKVHPQLDSMVTGRLRTLSVIVGFKDSLVLPLMPLWCLPRSLLWTPSEFVANVYQKRSAAYQNQRALLGLHGGVAGDSLWVIQALAANMPSDSIYNLAGDSTVLYIQPRYEYAPLPIGCVSLPKSGSSRAPCKPDEVHSTSSTSVPRPGTVRDDVNITEYLGEGWGGRRLAIFDSGVDQNHKLFYAAGLDAVGDCTDGSADCSGPSPADICAAGHGTGSAAIISAGCWFGDDFRGLTDAKLDAFRIYRPHGDIGEQNTRCSNVPSDTTASGGDPTFCNVDLDILAACKGIQHALLRCDPVLAIETQASGGLASALSLSAENAFNVGAVVVAANGNGVGCEVGVPAVASGVIGVGAYHGALHTPEQNSVERVQGRFKPDLLAASGLVTASRDPTNEKLASLGNTSGATPVAASMALLLRNWLLGLRGNWVDPGQVYAMMIASASYDPEHAPMCTEDDEFFPCEGAGRITLPKDGLAWWGKVDLKGGGTAPPIDLDVDGLGLRSLDVALWWHDDMLFDSQGSPLLNHTQVFLRLDPPKGLSPVTSESLGSVFQRVRSPLVDSDLTGRWSVGIRNLGAFGTMQTVYWAVIGR